ncbi:hypothetical protein NDU88_003169 [Pleurodeles waltl]|uniref:Uncharacterized protein n=1 Tax=Pleurodeles waltl TaxID=8319 RepID=A0AAV7UC07_PLEWA|nr:hypothetical protein NDU88_003169 [Pleurodeles waltl]
MRSHPLRSSVAERRRRAGSRRSQSGTKETGSREQDASTRHTSGEAWQKQATADSGLSQVVARKEERGRQVPTAANRAVPHVQGPRSRKMVTWMVGHSFIHWVVNLDRGLTNSIPPANVLLVSGNSVIDREHWKDVFNGCVKAAD